MKAPPIYKQAWNFASTVWKHSQNDWKLVTKEHPQARLQVCETSGPDGKECPEKKGNRCMACGCNLWLKSGMDITQCESTTGVDKWEKVDKAHG